MSESDSVVVYLLDKEYRVACPPGERESLLRAARHLDERMQEVKESNVIGLERIAVMAALNLAHELLESRERAESEESASSRIDDLLGKVENELRAMEATRENSGR